MTAITLIAETADTVTLARADFEALLDAVDDKEAAAAFERTRGEESFPAEVVDRIMAGESPVKVYRAHRGMSVRALASAAGLSPAYVSNIETGKLAGSVAALKAIAAALGVDLDDVA